MSRVAKTIAVMVMNRFDEINATKELKKRKAKLREYAQSLTKETGRDILLKHHPELFTAPTEN